MNGRSRQVQPKLLQSALLYAAKGWPVFPIYTVRDGRCACESPCSSAGKHPRTPNGFKNATTNRKKIEGWWKKWPDANIGVHTGKASGFIVLDIDKEHGGEDSLRELERQFGQLPRTREQRTGAGRHLLFSNQTLSNRSRVKPGLDMRGNGGYIVAPPSAHICGSRYQWTNENPIAEPPSWLLEVFESASNSTFKPSNPQNTIHPGNRNTTLTSIAGAMRRGGASPESIEAALITENNRRCVPTLLVDEVRRIAVSIGRYPVRELPRVVSIANVESEEVAWLWWPYLPLGKVSLLQGIRGWGRAR